MGAQVEVRIVDPNRVGDVQWHPADALAVAGHQVDALLDGLLDPEGAAPARHARAAFEHVDSAEVEWRRRPLGVETPRVPSRQRLVEGLTVRGHAVIL